MRDEGKPSLWVDGEMILRVWEPGASAPGPALWIDQPFALVGRAEGSDIRIADDNVSSRHAYLHLDERGLYGVDLATRTGTRFHGAQRSACWLHQGQFLEVAGRRIELVGLRADGAPPRGEPADGLLTDAGETPLPRVTLRPASTPNSPWSLNSELVFLGRSSACGVRVDSTSAMRIHCAIARTPRGVFVIDLGGRGVWIGSRLIQGAAALFDGDELTIGAAAFRVRVESSPAAPVKGPGFELARRQEQDQSPAPAPAPAWPTELLPGVPLPPLPAGLALGEGASQAALLAWMMGALQAAQNEMLRRQENFQHDLVQALRVLHRDTQGALQQHQRRVEDLHRELAALREDIRQRFGSGSAPTPQPPSLPKPPPLRIPQPPPPNDPAKATAWLLHRVGQIDQDSRASWKDLIGRLSGSSKGDS